jgi:uncharacterized protein
VAKSAARAASRCAGDTCRVRRVGSTERVRRVAMKIITAGFIGGVGLAVGISLLGDLASSIPQRLAASMKRRWHSPIISHELWRELRSYNEPGFHTSDRDAAELLAIWQERLFGARSVLNDRLAGVA